MKLRLVLLFFCCMALFGSLYAQNTHLPAPLSGKALLDSLMSRLNSAPADTNTANLLDAIAYNFGETNPDSQLKYAGLEVDLARKLQYKRGIAGGTGKMGEAYFQKSNFPVALQYFLESLQIWEQLQVPGKVAIGYSYIGAIYETEDHFDLALQNYQKALALSMQSGDKMSMQF